jgi:hypothetical protein
VIVEPSVGIVFGKGVSAHPKFTKFVPDAPPPWVGVSIAPNGFVAWALSQVIVRVPNSCVLPSRSWPQM